MKKVRTRRGQLGIALQNRAFRQARDKAGMTQEQAAAVLGVSVGTMKAVDSGATRCSPELAAKAEFMFGVDRRTILEGRTAKDLFGNFYTGNSYKIWEQTLTVTNEEFDEIKRNSPSRLAMLLEAGRKSKKLTAVLALFEEMITKAVTELDIRNELKHAWGDQPKSKRIPLLESTAFELTQLLKKRLRRVG
jgi:DNA-binding XRE family transcriptional regulator